MNNKPRIYKPNVNIRDNNKKTYYSFLEDSYDTINDVDSFIENLTRDNSYVFSKDVIIETKTKIYDTRIAGKFGSKIITLDNDIISTSDIVRIYEKNKK